MTLGYILLMHLCDHQLLQTEMGKSVNRFLLMVLDFQSFQVRFKEPIPLLKNKDSLLVILR